MVGPVTAVLRITGQHLAFAAEDAAGKLVARQRAIKVGPMVGDSYPILDGISASGNAPEQNALDAMAEAARQPFRSSADKVIVLISDSSALTPDREMIDPVDLAEFLKSKKIDYVHLAVPDAPVFKLVRVKPSPRPSP